MGAVAMEHVNCADETHQAASLWSSSWGWWVQYALQAFWAFVAIGLRSLSVGKEAIGAKIVLTSPVSCVRRTDQACRQSPVNINAGYVGMCNAIWAAIEDEDTLLNTPKGSLVSIESPGSWKRRRDREAIEAQATKQLRPVG